MRIHLFITIALFFSVSSFGAELKQGRYIGWIELAEQKERLAVVADIFLESPEDFTKFPRLNASFRINLGGYNTHEYINETFHDLKYDFDNGALTFDEEGNDLLMTTTVVSVGGRAKIAGDIFIRSIAGQGKLELVEESDEPGDDFLFSPPTAAPKNPFSSLLEGQYEGTCSGKSGVFQIQTVRGLKIAEKSLGLERHYGISGRLAFKNHRLCGNLPNGQWCTLQFFRNGTFNLYSGRLSFQSDNGTEECSKKGDELSCRLRVSNESLDCKFKKPSQSQPVRFYSRGFHLNPSSDQTRALPEPSPPRNESLAQTLKGRFWGYLHNETNNTYMPVRLDVVSFSSTENPHNPNQMMVSATASFFLGRDFSGPFIIQRFDPRSFYLRPGFMLSGSAADSFLNVTNWKSGFLSGNWISRSFGKVGTFQFIKGEVAPLPASAKAVQSFAGSFERMLVRSKQWIRFFFPTQADHLKDQVIPLSGSYQAVAGNAPVRLIEEGTFDLFTGRLGWITKQNDAETFGSGYMHESGDAYLFLPPWPIYGALTRSLEFEKFQRGTQ